MGQFAVSGQAGEELAIVGLGSCIALMLLDEASGFVALAHVVLPAATGSEVPPCKYAELAVPHLVGELKSATQEHARIGAVLVGGAQMFRTAVTMDIGRRNAEAVRAALATEKIPILAEEIGGTAGRTARAVVGQEITVQTAGGPVQHLLSLAPVHETRARALLTGAAPADARPGLGRPLLRQVSK